MIYAHVGRAGPGFGPSPADRSSCSHSMQGRLNPVTLLTFACFERRASSCSVGTGAPCCAESQGLVRLAPRAHPCTFPSLPRGVPGALCLGRLWSALLARPLLAGSSEEGGTELQLCAEQDLQHCLC